MSQSETSNEQPIYKRKIRSFVTREGRLTKGQAKALETYWPTMGLEYAQGMQDLTQAFDQEGPVVLEIGFGMGHSLVQMAADAPDTNFIGIEVHRPGVGACLMEAERQDVSNLRIYQHDAVEVLENCIPDASLSRVQIYFPDPWHKKRHHKRRIVQPAFVQTLRKKLKVGGHLHLATDWENYAEHMLEVMQDAEGYQNLSDSSDYVPKPDYRPETKFERRGQRLGHGVWDLLFERVN
ncbi:tRNA (guanine(46)-N(7))-methyltransferase [Saliniradius amylolyticus]|uniref:tRNA (guanine-N(7)-)-methyltransferase n=1 Tax=Saliniradius amylolyticus TaxID=2183582 RepID=A0A2S2DZM5_9ALTE|nr:tRNA (guanosine(46)-N7)-methyltransferase TrmB [Saliniradius amylolyticus]AWL10813.1 tRNA (guanine(46)-N(7))-methyltransferase [Saliniradius amylolyticus]